MHNSFPTSGDSITFTRGNKLFELTNHLGNVLATISDKRYGVSTDDSTVVYYNPELVSANDYYPFGMLQYARSWTEPNVGNYRFGFNGKENDNEVKGVGNSMDYGKRIYDPRTGRFLSLDPLTQKYPDLTPYQFASNTPIEAIDIDGLEKYIIHYIIENGSRIILSQKTDNSPQYQGTTVMGQPVIPKVVQFILEDKNGKVLSVTGDIPLKNYGSTLYVGPLNPKYGPEDGAALNGHDRYDYPAINILDLAAKHHDLAYNHAYAAGFSGALFDLATIDADKKLLADAQEVVDMYFANQKDPVNKQDISEETYNAASNVVDIFTGIVTEKEARILINKAAGAVKSAGQTVEKTISDVSQKAKDAIDGVKDFIKEGLNETIQRLTPTAH